MSNRTESDYATGVYRCRDSIKSLKIRIQIQQEKSSFIPLADFQEAPGDAERISQAGIEQSEIEERIISWQEKVFSPYEISRYQHANNCHTPLEKKYHQDVRELYGRGDIRANNRIFTYTSADDYTAMDDVNVSVTTGTAPLLTPLVLGAAEVRRRHTGRKARGAQRCGRNRDVVDYCPTEEAKLRNHLLESSPEVMYILADLSAKDSLAADTAWYGRSEYVLCTVRYDPSAGTLSVTPAFSPSAPRGTSDPHRIEVDGDARNVYQYWVEHASAGVGEQERLAEKEVMDKLCAHRREVLHLRVGDDFSSPPGATLRAVVLGEVACAARFEHDPLHVRLTVRLPPGWSCADRSQLTVTTQSGRRGADGVTHFGHLFQVALTLDLETLNADSPPRWPHVFVAVASLDAWTRHRVEGYGHVALPCRPGVHRLLLPTWRPLAPGSAGEMRRFFVGGAPQLDDVAFAGIPDSFKGSHLGKYGVRTIASGDVTLKLNVVHQSQAFVRPAEDGVAVGGRGKQAAAAAFLLERLGAATLVDSVNAVLKAFRLARERMQAAKQGLEAKDVPL